MAKDLSDFRIICFFLRQNHKRIENLAVQKDLKSREEKKNLAVSAQDEKFERILI